MLVVDAVLHESSTALEVLDFRFMVLVSLLQFVVQRVDSGLVPRQSLLEAVGGHPHVTGTAVLAGYFVHNVILVRLWDWIFGVGV